jgi:hypothetical protein
VEPSQRINLVYAWNDSPNCGWPIHHKEWILISTRDHHRSPLFAKEFRTGKLPPHPLTCFVTPCMTCMHRQNERKGVAPFLAFVPDNGFKSVCQLKWAYSKCCFCKNNKRLIDITHPHSDVYWTHPHPHHTPLVNGLQHLYARN